MPQNQHIFIFTRQSSKDKDMFTRLRIFTRLPTFSFKLLSMTPKMLREVISENFKKLNKPETSTSGIPESRVEMEKKSLGGRDFFQSPRPPAPTLNIFFWVGA